MKKPSKILSRYFRIYFFSMRKHMESLGLACDPVSEWPTAQCVLAVLAAP